MMKISSLHDRRYAAAGMIGPYCSMIDEKIKAGLKRKMLDACVIKQQRLISDFTSRIKALTETQGLGNEESFDNSEQAANTLKTAEINALNQLLEFANAELALLKSLKEQDTRTENAGIGSVVVTNRNTFLVSASIEGFEVDGKSYTGISTQSPLFQAMKGKRAGGTFSYKGITYTIQDIF